jgi:hypothetical protein
MVDGGWCCATATSRELSRVQVIGVVCALVLPCNTRQMGVSFRSVLSSLSYEPQGLGESRRKPCTTMSLLSTMTPSSAANLLGGVAVAFPNHATLGHVQVKI